MANGKARTEVLDERRREELKGKLKQAMTMSTMQGLLTKLSTQCFEMCVPQPDESLDSRQRSCISLCMDRYMDSFNLVARTYGNRLQAELKRTLDYQTSVAQDDVIQAEA